MNPSRFIVRRRSILSFAALQALALAACALPASSSDDAPAAEPTAGVRTPPATAAAPAASTPAAVPDAMRVAFHVTEPGVVEIDARRGRFLLPLPTEPRRFADHDALRAFVRDTFGAAERGGGALELRTEQHGEAHFWDEEARALFRVIDPVAATIGGVSGDVIVGGEVMCFDPDGVCDGLASYLEPVATPSAPSTRHASSGEYKVDHHSFFYNVLGFYMRAGGNSRITQGDPMGRIEIKACAPADTVTPATRIETLLVDVRTGGDDLRGGDDNATAVVTLADGTVLRRALNDGKTWRNDALHTVVWSLPRAITAGEIRRFGIETSFGGGAGGDNWDMKEVALRFEGDAPRDGTLLVKSGSPLVRFTGDRRTWSTVVDAATVSSNTPVQRVFVTVRTGGDDLRGGNDNAFARLVIDGRTTTATMVNGGARWADGSRHAFELAVPSGTTFGTLRGLELSTSFNGGLGGDNWNVDQVVVEAESPGGTRRPIAQLDGAPLVRFSGSRKTWETIFPVPGGPRLCATRHPAQSLSVDLTVYVTRESHVPGVRDVLPLGVGAARETGEPFVEKAVLSVFGGNTRAVEGALNTAVGVCSSHRGPGGPVRTGAGDTREFCE